MCWIAGKRFGRFFLHSYEYAVGSSYHPRSLQSELPALVASSLSVPLLSGVVCHSVQSLLGAKRLW